MNALHKVCVDMLTHYEELHLIKKGRRQTGQFHLHILLQEAQQESHENDEQEAQADSHNDAFNRSWS